MVALSKKSRQRKLRKNLEAHESDYTQAKHTKTRIRLKAA
jgi:hypothetical protein